MHWRFLSDSKWLFLPDPEWRFSPDANNGFLLSEDSEATSCIYIIPYFTYIVLYWFSFMF